LTGKGSDAVRARITQNRDALLNAGPRTGDQWLKEVETLRDQGHKNIMSDDVDARVLGHSQLDMANAVETHLLQSIPENAPVTAEQFQLASQQLAKNRTIEAALSLGGKDVDMAKIARVNQENPKLLTGGLKDVANFAANNQDVSGVGGRVRDPSLLTDS